MTREERNKEKNRTKTNSVSLLTFSVSLNPLQNARSMVCTSISMPITKDMLLKSNILTVMYIAIMLKCHISFHLLRRNYYTFFHFHGCPFFLFSKWHTLFQRISVPILLAFHFSSVLMISEHSTGNIAHKRLFQEWGKARKIDKCDYRLLGMVSFIFMSSRLIWRNNVTFRENFESRKIVML